MTISKIRSNIESLFFASFSLPSEEDDKIIGLMKRVINGEDCEVEIHALRTLQDQYTAKEIANSKGLEFEVESGIGGREEDAYWRGYDHARSVE